MEHYRYKPYQSCRKPFLGSYMVETFSTQLGDLAAKNVLRNPSYIKQLVDLMEDNCWALSDALKHEIYHVQAWEGEYVSQYERGKLPHLDFSGNLATHAAITFWDSFRFQIFSDTEKIPSP